MTYIVKNTIKQLSSTTGIIALASIDIANNAVLTVTPTGNITLNQTAAFSDGNTSSRWRLEFTQNATTAYTLALGTNILTPGGVAPVISASLGGKDTLIFETDGLGNSRLVEHRKAYA